MRRSLTSALLIALTTLLVMASSTDAAAQAVRVGNWQLAGSSASDYPQASSLRTAYEATFGGAANVTVTDFGQQTGWPSQAQLDQLDILYMTKFVEFGYTNPFTVADIDRLYNFVARGGHLVYVAEGEGAANRTLPNLLSRFNLTVTSGGIVSPNPRGAGQNAMGLGSAPPPLTTRSLERYVGLPACHNVYADTNFVFPGPAIRTGSLFISGEVQDFSQHIPLSTTILPRLVTMHRAYLYGSAAELNALDTTGLVNPAHPNYKCSPYTWPAYCGDGTVGASESCDDGNVSGGDGCSASCAVEPGYTCPTAGGLCLTVDVTTPTQGALLNQEPSISGTATANAQVTIVWTNSAGQQVGTATVTATGAGDWVAPPRGLMDGVITATATVTTTGGPVSDAVTYTLDTTPPPVAITAPLDGAVTNDSTPNIRGTTQPGATVTVTITNANGQTVQRTPSVNASGVWTFNASALPEGAVMISVVATDPAGNLSAPVSVNITIDLTPPPVVILSPEDPTITQDPTPTITGTTEPGATLVVTLTDMGGATQTQNVTVLPDGSWSVDAMMLAEGTYTITATATDAAGNSATSAPVSLSVDVTAPALAIVTPQDGAVTTQPEPSITGTTEPGSAVIVTILDAQGATVSTGAATVASDGTWSYSSPTLMDGTYTVSAVASDVAGNSASAGPVQLTIDTTAPEVVIVSPAPDSAINEEAPTITGTTEPEAMVIVTLLDAQGVVVDMQTVTADVSGAWSTMSPTLTEGDYVVTASATDAAGNTSAPVSAAFTVDLSAPELAITAPADGELLTTRTIDVTGTSEPGATITVTLLDADGEVVDTQDVSADAAGDWTTRFEGVADGDYTLSAVASDAAGNTSEAAEISVTMDSQAPELSVTSPADGSVSEQTQPSIEGTTDPGASITIVLRDAAGQVVETLTATPDASGAFSATPTAALAAGDYTIEVTATAPNGLSTTVNVTTTVASPDAPVVITSPGPGAQVTGPSVTVTGTGAPGQSVSVSGAGATQTVTIGEDGTWSVTLTDLPAGETLLTATSGDDSASVTVTILLPETPPVGLILEGGGCTSAPGAPAHPWALLALMGGALVTLRRRRRA